MSGSYSSPPLRFDLLFMCIKCESCHQTVITFRNFIDNKNHWKSFAQTFSLHFPCFLPCDGPSPSPPPQLNSTHQIVQFYCLSVCLSVFTGFACVSSSRLLSLVYLISSPWSVCSYFGHHYYPRFLLLLPLLLPLVVSAA